MSAFNADMDVSIEPLAPEHYSRVAQWVSDPGTNRWLYSEWREGNVDERTIAIVVMNHKKNRLYLIRYQQAAVGVAAISQISPVDRHAVIWYLVGEAAVTGRGVASQAIALLLERAVTELDLNSLEASVLQGNLASEKVLSKNRFRRVGVLHQAAFIGGRPVDRAVFEWTRNLIDEENA